MTKHTPKPKKRMGHPPQDIQLRPIDHLEAFCCAQIARIEHHLAERYGADYNLHRGDTSRCLNGRGQKDLAHYNQFHVMPQNDHMTRTRIYHECDIETRGNCGAGGCKKPPQDDEGEGNVARKTVDRLDSFIDGVARKRLTYARLTA